MEDYGLGHLEKDLKPSDFQKPRKSSRITTLVSIASAFAVNCTSSLEEHMALAETVGISKDEITSALDAALFIKGEATHYVEQLVSLEKKYGELQELYEELRRTQAMLLQSEKMAALGKLVAVVVHEMNTPIGVINSGSDLAVKSIEKINEILKTCESLEKLREDRHFQISMKALQNNYPTTINAINRILQIITSLRSFARLDEADFQKVDIHEGIDSVLTLLKPEFSKRIEISKKYGKIPPVNCYPGELNQVFMHLLSNAVNAIEGKGTIEICTALADETVQIQITDSGCGIPCDKLEHLFDPGFIDQGSRVKAGFGLFTSYHIMQKHQGEIQVESQVGEGSSFTVSFPGNLSEQITSCKEKKKEKPKSRCEQLK